MFTRRQFLQRSSLVSLSPVLPAIFSNTARAAGSAPDSRALVVIQLDGGNDGINTVVPYADDGYSRARKELRLETAKLHKLDDHVGLHPGMTGAKELFDAGRLTVVQGVGYPNPDRSHFRSMKIWQMARRDEREFDGYGWLGRALDLHVAKPASGADAVFVGDDETPVALWGRRSSATSLSRATDLQLAAPLGPPLAVSRSAPHQAQFVARQLLSARAAADEFARQQTAATAPDRDYPETKLAARLKLVAQLLKCGAQSRVYYTMQTGYDTHSAQLFTHAGLLREFADALAAFLDDLRAAKLEDRVVVLAFSEFGRRVDENASRGTDHGTAGPVFLAGSSLAGGLVGEPPSLTDLDAGDLRVQTDFRGVYAALLEGWLGVDSASVLGARFEPVDLWG